MKKIFFNLFVILTIFSCSETDNFKRIITEEILEDGYTGKGTYIAKDGIKFIGKFKDGKYMCYTHFEEILCYFPNGDKYIGEWKNNKMHGKGALHFKNGDSFYGEFINGEQKKGGLSLSSSGISFQGEFINNLPSYGTLSFNSGRHDGDKYIGDFENGQMHGEGTYKTKQNEYVGQWENGEYVSQWYNGKYVQPLGIKNKEIGTFSFISDNNNDTINISVPLKKPKENYFYTNNHPNANGLEFSIQIPDGYTAEEGQRANTVQVFTKENKLPITIHIYPYKDYKDDLPDFVQFSNDSDAFKSNVKNLVNELKTTNNIYYYECIGYPGYIAEGEESGITSHQLNIFLEKNLFVISITKRNITKFERDILKECYESLELVKTHQERMDDIERKAGLRMQKRPGSALDY